jgi:hypothetical protein
LGADYEDLQAIAKGAFQPLMNNNPVLLSEEKIVELLAHEL